MTTSINTLIANATSTVSTTTSAQAVKNSTKAENAAKVAYFVTEFDKLAAERLVFEKTEYAASNARLYAILAEIYEHYLSASVTKSLLASTVKALKARLKEQGVVTQGNSLAVSLFVRYVFPDVQRQRIQNYTRSIQAAVAAKVEVAEFANFVISKHGVEACKKDFVPSAKTVTKKQAIEANMPIVNTLLAELDTSPAAVLDVSDDFTTELDDNELTILIGKTGKDGKVKVYTAVPAQGKGVSKWAKEHLALYIAKQNGQLTAPVSDQSPALAPAANETVADLEKLAA
jgi:hypothetical protein